MKITPDPPPFGQPVSDTEKLSKALKMDVNVIKAFLCFALMNKLERLSLTSFSSLSDNLQLYYDVSYLF